MPAKIALLKQRLQHELLHHFPVRREAEHVHAEVAHGALDVLFEVGAQKAMVKAHHKRFDAVLLDQVVERPGAVFAAAEWDDAVVVALAAVLLNQRIEGFFVRSPVDLRVFDFVLAANVANAMFIKRNGLVGFGESTTRATLHLHTPTEFMFARLSAKPSLRACGFMASNSGR
jgi:hypothetical protein